MLQDSEDGVPMLLTIVCHSMIACYWVCLLDAGYCVLPASDLCLLSGEVSGIKGHEIWGLGITSYLGMSILRARY